MSKFEFGPCDPSEYLGGMEGRLRRPPELAASPQTHTWVDVHRDGASMLAARIHDVDPRHAASGLYVVKFTIFIDREQLKGINGHALFDDGMYLHEVGEKEALLIPRQHGVASTPIEGYFRKTKGSSESAGMVAVAQAAQLPEIDLSIPQLADDVGGDHSLERAREPVLV
ncbi:MAG TPA: hypothetical protein VFW77_02520 [Candidatus Saccharimonadales bacterium]|nr:hypothetical protein [Candidatus Saccharimonadales bacterium]